MILRPLTESDLPQILLIEELGHIAPWSQDIFERCFKSNYRAYGLANADHLLGFVMYSLQAGECHILNICVHPEHQSQGLGRQLINYAVDKAEQEGASIAFLEVRRSNERALGLYQDIGFVEVGVRKDYYPSKNGREDALILAKDLSIS